MRYLYKYPQAEYPYGGWWRRTARRSRQDPPFTLLDTGVFNDSRYFDVEVRYAKASPDEIHIRVIATNRGPEAATIHLIPHAVVSQRLVVGRSGRQAGAARDPARRRARSGRCRPSIRRSAPTTCTAAIAAQTLYTENESNAQRLWNVPNATPYVKDAFHRRIVNGEKDAVNPDATGTKFGAWHVLDVRAGPVGDHRPDAVARSRLPRRSTSAR